MIRPMTSNVSALSSVVAKGHQAMRYPYPADCPVSFDGSSTGHASLRLFCRDSAVSDMPLTGF
jgi:hypothetical protein